MSNKMPNMDNIEIEILEDGRIKVKTGSLAGVNHTTADRLLRDMIALAGGDVVTEKSEHEHHHHHHHGTHSHKH